MGAEAAPEPEQEAEEDEQVPAEAAEEDGGDAAEERAGPSSAAEGSMTKKTMEDRMAKLKELRMKMVRLPLCMMGSRLTCSPHRPLRTGKTWWQTTKSRK